MMNSFFEKLASGSLNTTSSDHLKLLGKRAARMYFEKDAGSLTDALRQVAGEEDLTPEQLRRVAETANQAAWTSAFVDSGERTVSFSPADAEAVIGEMASKPDEVDVRGVLNLDYSLDAPNERLPEDFNLAAAFGMKDDLPEYAALNPSRSEEIHSEKVASARDLARFGADQILSDLARHGEDLYDLVKQAHIRDGFGFLQISRAVGDAMESADFANAVMQGVARRLESEGVRFSESEELQKLAHPIVVNFDHPLMKTAAVLERLAFAYYSAEGEHQKLAADHRVAAAELKKSLRARL